MITFQSFTLYVVILQDHGKHVLFGSTDFVIDEVYTIKI